VKVADSPAARVMDIVAGPPGSGKSTFFRVADRGNDSFNIDERRRELNKGSSRNIPAAVRQQSIAEYEAFIEGHIRDGRSFSFEATLAKDITFQQADRAKRAGFEVHLTYVVTKVEECVERVKMRALRGGHAAPESVLEDVHAGSMRNLSRAIRSFDVVQVYDNSVQAERGERLHEAKPTLVLEARQGTVAYVAAAAPEWLKAALTGSEYELD